MCKIIHCAWNYTLCVKLHTVCKTTHFMHAITKQVLLRTNWKILHLTEFVYTTSGCDGCDKYLVWVSGATSQEGYFKITKKDHSLYLSQTIQKCLWRKDSLMWRSFRLNAKMVNFGEKISDLKDTIWKITRRAFQDH